MTFQVMSLTDRAAERVREILDNAELPDGGLHIGVQNGGCAGMEYTLDVLGEPGQGDDVVEDKGVKLFVAGKAVLFLLGTELDFEATKLRTGFVFNNPNQTSACGCGESVTLQAASMPG